MAGSTERVRALSLLLGGALALATPGCAIGGLEAVAERSERVAWFRAVRTDGEQLWIAYEAQIENADGERLGTRERAVLVRVADLDPALRLPVEDVPFECIDPDDVPVSRTRPAGVAMVRWNGVDTGFRLLEPGAPPDAHLRADSLTRRTTAPWAWPLYPFAALWDAVAIPFLTLLGIPIFAWNP